MFRKYSPSSFGAAVLAVGTLAGCADDLPKHPSPYRSTALVSRTAVTETPLPPAIVGLPAAPVDLRPVPRTGRTWRGDPVDANARALRTSTSYPTPSGYTNAVMVYDYQFGQVYKVYGAPLHVTMIALQPGERLLSKAAGDTVRWIVGDTASGSGPNRRALVLLKPLKPGLQTNLLLTTDRRVYLLDLQSGDGNSYQNAIAWNYGDDPEVMAQAASQQANDIGSDINVANLNFGYKIYTDQGTKPVWQPTQAFDDGTKTYIEFPPELGSMEAPPFFIREPGGKHGLVNYRVKGRFYIVDRLFTDGELVFGDYKHQTIVRIESTHPQVLGD